MHAAMLARQQTAQHTLAHAVIADQADTVWGKCKLQIGKQRPAIGQDVGKTVEL